jgi:hypothetical protein
MITPEEKDFLEYWEKNRDRQRKLSWQLLLGIPAGLLFIVPMVISLSAHWHKRADVEANSALNFNPWVILVAFLIIAVFIAVFSKKLSWDKKEQRYLELKAKRDGIEKV